jgi:phage terminase small subunit
MTVENGLTNKQLMFVTAYLIDLNATNAAMKAGYSKKTADVQGCRLLTNVKIQAEVQKHMDKRAAKFEISADSVLQELAKLAFANIQDIYDEAGQLKDIHTLPREVAAALQSTKVNLTEACAIQEVRMYDKGANLERLGRHLKLFTDNVKLSGAVSLLDILAEDPPTPQNSP